RHRRARVRALHRTTFRLRRFWRRRRNRLRLQVARLRMKARRYGALWWTRKAELLRRERVFAGAVERSLGAAPVDVCLAHDVFALRAARSVSRAKSAVFVY